MHHSTNDVNRFVTLAIFLLAIVNNESVGVTVNVTVIFFIASAFMFVQVPSDEEKSVCGRWNMTMNVEFTTEHGDIPLMSVSHGRVWSGNIKVFETVKGTKEDVECSARGICNRDVGVCNCFDGFYSSNGSRFADGHRGDCGFRHGGTEQFVGGGE